MHKRRPAALTMTAGLLTTALALMAIGGVAAATTAPSAAVRATAAGPTVPPNPATVPAPTADPFYDQPATFAGDKPGQVLAARPVSIAALPTYTAYQLQYVSTNTVGVDQADVTTVILPLSPAASPALVAYEAPIDSLSYNCDPSYELRNGQEEEVGMMTTLLTQGWTVTVPDFLGPDHEWASGYVEAHGTLDGIRATEDFAAAGLDGTATPVGLTGYSGGARGAEFANELAGTYAPELNIVGAAPGGLAADIADVMASQDGKEFSGVYFAAFFGLGRAYPSIGADALMNAAGKQMESSISTMCIGEYTALYVAQRMEMYTVNGVNPLTMPSFEAVNASLDAGRYGTPRAPTYIYMGSNDELVVPANVGKLVDKYCAEGLTVDYVQIPGEHVSTLATGFPGAVAWLADRFAGKPAPSTCSVPTAAPTASPVPTSAASSSGGAATSSPSPASTQATVSVGGARSTSKARTQRSASTDATGSGGVAAVTSAASAPSRPARTLAFTGEPAAVWVLALLTLGLSLFALRLRSRQGL